MSRAATLALLALLQAVSAAAQPETDDGPDNWYQVELLVFANRSPEAAASERWPLLPELAYPERWQQLERGSLYEPADRELRFTSMEKVVAGPLDLFWDRSINALWTEYYERQLKRFDPQLALELPRQRVLLPADRRELNSQRNRIDGTANLDVLFHQSWVQRIEDRERSLPIILDGPIRFGDYPELQGSVLLYSGRYLHIATNLWLNTGGQYLDAELRAMGWAMPAPPLPVELTGPPRPLRVEVSPYWLDLDAALAALGLDDEADSLRPDAGAMEAESAAASEPAPGEPPGANGEPSANEEPSDIEPKPPAPVTFRKPLHDYEFRHAVLVQQHRRMRSGELHYIDHPLLGIIIKVTRYEFQPFLPDVTQELAETR